MNDAKAHASTFEVPTDLSALDAVAVGITVQDAQGRVIYCNDAAAKLIGLPGVDAVLRATPEELMAAFEILDAEGRRLPLAELPGRRLLQGKEPAERLVRFRSRGSEEADRWAWVAARPLAPGPTGRPGPVLILNTFLDASEGVRAREATERLATSEHRLRLAMDAGNLGTWQWDIERGAVEWSAELERMHGIREGSFAGTFEAYQSDIHPEDRDRVLATIRQNLEQRTDHRLLYRIVRPDGVVRWLEARGRFELAVSGAPTRLAGICMDVTERVRAEESRKTLAAEQAASKAAEMAALQIREVLAAISDAFAVCSGDWVVVFANEESAKRLGRRPEEVMGKNLWELAPGIAGTPFESELRRAMSGRVVTRLEAPVLGTDEWVELIAYPLPEGGLAIYSRDVTPRKREEERRARAAAADALHAEVGSIMAGRGIVSAMLQRCCEAVIRYPPFQAARVWLVDSSGQWLDLEANAGGEAVPAGRIPIGALEKSVLSIPLKVGDQVLGLLCGVATAPTHEDAQRALERTADAIAHGIDRRRAEIMLDDRARELARSNADLEQFAYVASHDLQEPLRIVASYNQLLARRYQGKLDADADDFIGFSVDGINRMQRLISDLLTYSRVGSRSRELVPVEVERVVAIALENLGHAIADAGARVTRDPLPQVRGDEGQLVQLFQNLIGNAIKFHGASPPVVHIGARPGHREWIFSVADNGVGIEAQYLERIFVIFQRLHARESYPGTGIGLALCKKIVEGQGGKIWVESTPGRGSTFFFGLPTLGMV